MVKPAVALLRKIWRQFCREIFRENRTLTLPVPAHPRGQELGAVPGTFEPPPEPQRALLEELTENVVSRLPDMDCRERGARVIAKLRDLVGDLPASADHHDSEPYGLLRHSLEVALKMLEEFEKMLFADVPPNAAAIKIPADSRQLQYLCFLAGLGHDLGKVFDMDVRAGDQRWSPVHQTYAEFFRHVEVGPVLAWNEARVRGSHAQFSPWLMHHILAPADIRFLGLEWLPDLNSALTGSHNADRSTPLAGVVSKLDQESVEQAAPEWMTKQPNSKVNLFIRALRSLIYSGELRVNSLGAPIYVTGDKAAVVIPLTVLVAREFLKRESFKLPSNHRLYDLLAQAEVVEADGNRQCVKRIRVPGKRGPAELSALIFNQDTIIPHGILPTLPKVTFEVVPEEPKPVVVANSGERKPTPDLESLG
jgi:Putative helicase